MMEAQQNLRRTPTRPIAIGLTTLALLVGGAGGYAIAAVSVHPQTVAGSPTQPNSADRSVTDRAASERADRAATAPAPVHGDAIPHGAAERADRLP